MRPVDGSNGTRPSFGGKSTPLKTALRPRVQKGAVEYAVVNKVFNASSVCFQLTLLAHH